MNIYNTSDLFKTFSRPSSKEEINEWLNLDNAINFLEADINDSHIILYASSKHLFLHSILIPNIEFLYDDIKDMVEWSGNPYTTWSIECSSSSYELYEPRSPIRNQSLIGEQIIFGRELDGVKGYENYHEINQKIVHALGLHYIKERNAWCNTDDNGDIVDYIKEISIELSKKEPLKIIYIDKRLLAKYTKATDQVLLRMIDLTFTGENFYHWGENTTHSNKNTRITYGRIGKIESIASYFRGIQIINLDSVAMRYFREENEEEKQYVELIVNDFKHNKIATISCSPNELDNYFIDTGKPFNMSPAFFKAEVLRKYKSDSEKYTINEKSICCRGSWSLRSYDINDAGQISVYLVDFNQLPYNEQLHWKQYNEEPKAPISKRAFETDFMGEFTDDILQLDKLKSLLYEMSKKELGWWKLRNKDYLNKLHYPLTQSGDEWAEELLIFDQLVIEGFEEKFLRNKAKELNVNIENKHRSLKLLEYILVAKGFELDCAAGIMSVFHDIHNLRSEVKGHISGDTAEKRKKDIITKYGHYRAHFDDLSQRMLESLNILIKELE